MNVQFTSPSTGTVIKTVDDINALEGKILLAVHNELSGTAVKKFSDKKKGLQRTAVAFLAWQAQQTSKPDKVADPETAKAYRKDSGRGKVIEACSKAGGATFKQLLEITGWDAAELRQCVARVETYNGLTVTKTGEPGDDQVIVVSGTLRTRKPFALDAKTTIKEHKPGTKRAKVVELLSSATGATFEQIQAETGWDERTAYEGIRLVNGYLGYGIRESGDGRISCFKK